MRPRFSRSTVRRVWTIISVWHRLVALGLASRKTATRVWTNLLAWGRSIRVRLIDRKTLLRLPFPSIALVSSIILLSPLLLPPGIPFQGDETYYIPWTLATLSKFNLQAWLSGNGPSADILSLVPTLILVGLRTVLGQDLAVKSYLLLMAWLSAIIPYIATKKLLRHWQLLAQPVQLEIASSVGGLIYLLFFYNQAIVAGSNSEVWNYVMFPLLACYLILFIDTGEFRQPLVFGFASVLASVQPFWPFLVGVVGIIYVVFSIVRSPHVRSVVRVLKNSSFVVGTAIAFNAFWIAPILAGYVLQAGSTFRLYTAPALINPGDLGFLSFWGLFEIFVMGEKARYFFWNHPQNYGPLSISIPLLAIASIALFLVYKRNRPIIFVGVVLIVGAFLTAGVNEPLGFVYYLIARTLPYAIGGILRNPTRFVPLVPFSYALLLGSGVIVISSKIPLRRLPVRLVWKKVTRSAVVFTLVLLILAPISYGTLLDLQGYTWPRYSPTNIPPQYSEINDWLTANPGNYKVMWIPSGGAYDWKQDIITAFPDLLSSKSTVPFSNIYPDRLSSTDNIGRLLAFMGVKYIVYHGDSTNYPNNRILQELLKQQDLTVVDSLNGTLAANDNSLAPLPIDAPGAQFGDSPFHLSTLTLQRQQEDNLTMQYTIPQSLVSQGYNIPFAPWFGILIHGFPAGTVDFSNRILVAGVSHQLQINNTSGFASFLVDAPLGNYVGTSIDLYANYYDSEYRQLTPLYFIDRLTLVPSQIINRYVIFENKDFAGAVFPENLNFINNSNVTGLLNSNASIISSPSANITNYEQTSEVELRVSARASSPFVLVLTEPYDRLWRAFIGNTEVKPTHVYGLVNGFLVNQTGVVNIRIYYTLQNYIYLGLGLSATSLSLSLLAIVLMWRRNRRKILPEPDTIVWVAIPARVIDRRWNSNFHEAETSEIPVAEY